VAVVRGGEVSAMIQKHRRFALRDVTLGGIAVGGATIDLWHDEAGTERWCARLLMPVSHELGDGRLLGTTPGGERLTGVVRLGDTTAGPRGGRHVLAQLFGEGPLVAEPEAPAEPT
jgi:hypothetical protein